MKEKTEFEYRISGTTYTQRKLVWYQIKQLKNHIKGVKFTGDMNALSLIDALEDKLPGAIAIILSRKGENIKDKDIDKIIADLEYDLDIETIVKIVEDFFLCNRVASVSEKLSGMMLNVAGKIYKTTPPLTKSSPSSPEETSQSETKSAGDTPPKSAKNLLNTAGAK